MFALKRNTLTLSRASSSSVQPFTAASRRCLSNDNGDSNSSSSTSTLNDLLSPMVDAPPRSPLSQPKGTRQPRARIPAAPITPLQSRSTGRTSLLTDDEAANSARQAFGNDISSSRSKSVSGRSPNHKNSPVFANSVVYHLYVLARSKSCIMTLVDERYNCRGSTSAGQCGFKNSAEGSYEAGYQCAVKILDVLKAEIERRRGEVEVTVDVMLNGYGQGRGALIKALSMAEGDGVRDAVIRVTDKTPIRVGGVRLQKKRRL